MDDDTLMAGEAAPAAPAAPTAAAAPTSAPTAAAPPTAAPTAAAAPATPTTPAPKPGEQAPEATVPEKYEFKAPEGFVVDDVLAGEFTPILKDLKLSQEQADKLVAFAPRLISASVDAAVSKTLGDLGYTGCKDWVTAVKADKELGGEKLTENMGLAKKARDQFATPELRKMLETTPLGNNPEVIRLFLRVGRAISADGYVPGGTARTPAPFFDKSPQLK